MGIRRLGQAKELTRDEATMNYTFKLSRRLAGFRAARTVVVAHTFLILACAGDQATGRAPSP